MEHPLTYAEARAEFPAIVDAVLARQRKSRGTFRDAAPETLQWSVQWGVIVEGAGSFQDVLRAAMTAPPRPAAPAATSVDDRVADELRRTRASLRAAPPRQVGWSVPLAPGVLPASAVALVRTRLAGQVAEAHRVAALSDADRVAETQAALAQLRGTPGFFEVRLPIPPRRR